ncbi:MAG TPA: CocE/NonD family hydrolase [Actinomycetota bacterium]|nr:CocE/NonD family hydrolase [Actinomycetota bacterium]
MRSVQRSLAVVLLFAAVLGPAAADPDGTARETGYIELPDGVTLAYTAAFPNDGKPHPTLFEYSGYNPGSVPDQPYIDRWVLKGYAYIGVNLRGTGCSGGTFDFFEPQQGLDGAYVIDHFIPTRPWSDGDVAMVGKSYPGITQLFVAEEKPTHLKAIAPGHFYGDIYRDVAFPGGIFNYSFAALWAFVAQPTEGRISALQAIAKGDATCAANVATHEVTNLRYNPFIQAQEHPFIDDLTMERSPITRVKDIDVPIFTAIAWQDEQVGPREVHLLEHLDVPYWAILTNGDHGMYRTGTSMKLLDAYLDHFLRGADNGFENNPRVMVWWEADTEHRAPSWVTGLPSWPPQATPKRLFLGAGGALSDDAPAAGGRPDQYVYPAGSQGIGNPYYGSASAPNVYLWPLKPLPGTALSYTSEAFTENTVLLGSASLDLWLASTAPDTDVQVTLTEVRPDGQEMYIQKGWLRASHRTEDAAISTDLRPVQTHLLDDFSPLVPGALNRMRVEIFPFGHVVRAASKIRVWIEAPTALPELWGFAFLPIPAVNMVYHDAEHPSSLVLPVVGGLAIDKPAYPACGTVIRQPCRPA